MTNTNNTNRGDRMSYTAAITRIQECAEVDWSNGNDDQITIEQSRSFVQMWSRREHWVEIAVAVLGVSTAARHYFDRYTELASDEYADDAE